MLGDTGLLYVSSMRQKYSQVETSTVASKTAQVGSMWHPCLSSSTNLSVSKEEFGFFWVFSPLSFFSVVTQSYSIKAVSNRQASYVRHIHCQCEHFVQCYFYGEKSTSRAEGTRIPTHTSVGPKTYKQKA